jgi:NAD+ synthase (glutamine-hydrolysing)
MKNYGFIRVAAAIPSVRVADVSYNLEQIKAQISEAEKKGVEILVFPELCLTGYTCQDLFAQRLLIDEAEQAVVALREFTTDKRIAVIVGVPVDTGKLLLNCAAVICNGWLDTLVSKTYLPNYGEFYEKRWFASAQDINDEETIDYAGTVITLTKQPQLFKTEQGVTFGVEICEDVWAPVPPSNHLALAGADLIFNLSASDELIGKHDYLKSLLAQQSARTMSGYVYSSCGFGESTQDVVYGGNALVYENGKLLAESDRFSFESQLVISEIDVEMLRAERKRNTTFVNAQRGEMAEMFLLDQEPDMMSNDEKKDTPADDSLCYRTVEPHPFIPKSDDMQRSCEEIFNIQVAGLAKRLVHTHSKTVIIGISGGLDSTLALLVCVKTFDKLGYDRKGIVGVTMPGFGTTDRTYHNAVSLMKSLGITMKEVNIAKAVMQHFEDIGHDASVHDVAYENSQARERTQILMDLTNELGGLVIGTGDLSELALGWATYNGDHMSMYGVNASIPKTLIRYLVRYVADTEVDEQSRETLLDVIDTPISPELIPADEQGNIKQKTEDLVGPYELHDFFLYYALRYGFQPAKIYMLAKVAFQSGQHSTLTYDDATIKKWLTVFYRRFFSQQFKRSCLPDGPKVGSVSLSPRGDWRMPSDANSQLWIQECESL